MALGFVNGPHVHILEHRSKILFLWSHLPLFYEFSQAKFWHFNRNFHVWKCHMRAKGFLTQISQQVQEI